ncbi:hypothetical protein NA78x_001289 [Anatilimnocola sp. NA78]|uniref:hypothetical protein n=1 Tax=Anatilimnocola sp. NA78 TaxID=3415683 RepID=UPI003CE526A9
MPRRTQTLDQHLPAVEGEIVERLTQELRSAREYGQPIIDERIYPAGKKSVTVIWDAWDRMPLEERTRVVRRAYELVEGSASQDGLVLASGLTVSEAHAAGMLPYFIMTARRESDPVTLDECRQAMIDEGASILSDDKQPQLRFSTEQEANAARDRLSKRLPGSGPVWVIGKDMGSVDDWYTR